MATARKVEKKPRPFEHNGPELAPLSVSRHQALEGSWQNSKALAAEPRRKGAVLWKLTAGPTQRGELLRFVGWASAMMTFISRCATRIQHTKGWQRYLPSKTVCGCVGIITATLLYGSAVGETGRLCRLSVNDLVEEFLLLAVDPDIQAIRKWDRPISLAIVGNIDARAMQEISMFKDRLNDFGGSGITVKEYLWADSKEFAADISSGAINSAILFGKRLSDPSLDGFLHVMASTFGLDSNFKQLRARGDAANCPGAYLLSEDERRILSFVAVATVARSDFTERDCVIAAMSRMVGFTFSSSAYQGDYLSGRFEQGRAPSQTGELFFRLLNDPKMRTGLERKSAAEVARFLIPEILRGTGKTPANGAPVCPN